MAILYYLKYFMRMECHMLRTQRTFNCLKSKQEYENATRGERI